MRRAGAPGRGTRAARTLALAALAIAALPLAAQSGRPADDGVVRTLPNGLRTWRYLVAGDSLLDVLLLVDGGAALDPPGKAGLAHFAEHVVFGDLPDEPERARNAVIESLGGTITAKTSLERTAFRVTIPARHAATALRWMARLVGPRPVDDALLAQQRPPFLLEMDWRPRGRLARVREVLLDPPWLRAASPWARAFGVAGPEEQETDPTRALGAVTAGDVRTLLARYYVARNMTLVLAGATALPGLDALVEATFGALPAGAPAVLAAATLRPMRRDATILVPGATGQVAVILRALGLTAEDRVVLGVLRDRLERRLDERLRYGERKVTYHPAVGLAHRGDAALLSIVASGRADDLAFIEASIDAELAAMRAATDDSSRVAPMPAPVDAREALVVAVRDALYHTAPGGRLAPPWVVAAGVTPARLARLVRERIPTHGTAVRRLQPSGLSPALLALLAAALAWGVARAVRRRLLVPADLRRVRYVARLRIDPPVAGALLLGVAVGAGLPAALVVTHARALFEALVVPLPGALQWGACAAALALGVAGVLAVGARLPRKILVFDDHVRIKGLVARSVVLPRSRIASCTLARGRSAWPGGRHVGGLRLALGWPAPGVLLRLHDGGHVFVRVRANDELRDAVAALLRAPA